MNKNLHRHLLVALALALVLSMTAVTALAQEEIKGADWTPTEEVTLRMMTWGGNARHEQRLSWVKEFEKLYPNIHIEYEAETEDSLVEKIIVQSTSGDAPDIYHMSSFHLDDFYDKGLCLNLAPYMESGLLSTAGFEEKLKAGQINGEQIQWPTMSGTYNGIYYNMTKFKELGVDFPDNDWTWDEYFDTMRALQAKITGSGMWASEDEGGLYRSFELWLMQRGKSFCNANGLNFDKEDMKEWLSIWDGLRAEGVVPPADIQSEYSASNWEQSMIVTGKVLMNTQSFTHLVGMNHDYPDDYGLVSPPWNPNGLKETPVISVGYCISPTSKHKNEAILFLNWLNQSEFVQESCFDYYSACTNQNISNKIRQALSDGSKEVQVGMLETIALSDYLSQYTVAYPPQPSGSTSAQDMLTAANELVAFGEMTVDEAVDDFFRQCEQVFSR